MWPDNLQGSWVIPVYKGADKLDVSNHKRESQILNLAKILDWWIYVRIYGFLEKNWVFLNRQSGFLKDRGTQNAMAYFFNYMHSKTDGGWKFMAAFIDLKKSL